jgi:hypothetical protein
VHVSRQESLSARGAKRLKRTGCRNPVTIASGEAAPEHFLFMWLEPRQAEMRTIAAVRAGKIGSPPDHSGAALCSGDRLCPLTEGMRGHRRTQAARPTSRGSHSVCTVILPLPGKAGEAVPLFRNQKKVTSILPGDIVQKMELYGHYEFDHRSVDGSVAAMVSQMLPALYPKATANPDSFISELAAAVLPHGGWAVYGGERLVRDLLGTDSRHPDFLRMLDAAIAFLRNQGYGPGHVAPYEMDIWRELHPGEPS